MPIKATPLTDRRPFHPRSELLLRLGSLSTEHMASEQYQKCNSDLSTKNSDLGTKNSDLGAKNSDLGTKIQT